jgi:hypothetical protein
MRRSPLLLALAISLPAVLACGVCDGLFESAQTRRAKEFVAAEEYETARQELRVQLHNSPDDVHAKALMLYMELADPDAGATGPAQCLLLESLPTDVKSTAAEEALQEAKLAVRKSALDRGVETRDWDEYVAALREAVDFGWKTHTFPPDRMTPRLTFAFCAALQGDETATAYLVDHLAKDDAKEIAQRYLYLVGDPAAKALDIAAKSPESLSRGDAETTLRNLRLARLLRDFSTEHKDRIAPYTVHTDGSDSRAANGGKFLMKLGWKDDNEALKPVLDAALARESLTRTLSGKTSSDKADAPVMLRQVDIGTDRVALLTVALPSSQSTEGATAAPNPGDVTGAAVDLRPHLQPAGINTTFLTEAWHWDGSAWKKLLIGDKPSISGPDEAVLAVAGPAADARLGPDQIAVLVYRGQQASQQVVNYGWYGSQLRTVSRSRVDRIVYHLGTGSLELVKLTTADGLDADADGNPLPMDDDEEMYGD